MLVSYAQSLPDLLSTPVPRKSEAEMMLERIERVARDHHARTGRFPKGTTQLTPKASCCLQNFEGKKKCAPVPSHWEAAPWKALGFAPDAPHYYQYSYSSKTGKSFVITAVGDLDCDATPITYELRGTLVANKDGKGSTVEVELIHPLPNSD